jgi:hypothetical protein
MRAEDTSDGDLREAVVGKPWQPYLEAALGFVNHWYPALFSAELDEGAAVGVELLGERRSNDGRASARLETTSQAPTYRGGSSTPAGWNRSSALRRRAVRPCSHA